MLSSSLSRVQTGAEHALIHSLGIRLAVHFTAILAMLALILPPVGGRNWLRLAGSACPGQQLLNRAHSTRSLYNSFSLPVTASIASTGPGPMASTVTLPAATCV